MRTHAQSRTLADVFAESVAVVRQDFGEFGFTGMLGAFAASFIALALRLEGSSVALGLIAPLTVLIALGTMATATAALRRIDDNLEPDAGRSFAAMLFRSPALAVSVAPSLVVMWIAVFAAAEFGHYAGSLAARATSTLVVLMTLSWIARRSLYVPALFARNTSVREAAEQSAALYASAPGTVALAWAMSLAPALVVLVGAWAAGFGAVWAALSAFAVVVMTPVAASMMWMLYQQASIMSMPAAAGPSRPVAPRVDERLRRHVR